MITEVRLTNFRGVEDHLLPMHRTTIIVGRNNAGKSTIVEALRLLSILINRYGALSFSDVPEWLDIPISMRGVRPSLKGMEMNFYSIFHRYGDPPGIIKATLHTRETVTIYIGTDERIHAVIKDSRGKPVRTKGEARAVDLPRIATLPQISPLAREEQILTPDYVRSAIASPLSSAHFRNQLNLFPDQFEEFKEVAQSSWPGLKIEDLEREDDINLPGKKLSLLVRDEDFVAEVGWMGHGLQMWLQTMWFLTCAHNAETIILDEPDVYMHADLQRRLIRLLRCRSQQVIIATHSVEIMSEVDPDHILVVDRRKGASTFTTTLPAVQSVIDHIGGVHNIQLARLWTCRRFLLVEGKDIRLLKQFQNILFPSSDEPFDLGPCIPIGGWGGWSHIIGSFPRQLENARGEHITPYCILDRDYHTPQQIEFRLKEARNRGIQLHVWQRKEIENYLLVPEAISRAISSRCKPASKPPNAQAISRKLDRIIQKFKVDVFDALAQEFLSQDKAAGIKQANKKARKVLDPAWQNDERRLSMVPAKRVLSSISVWAQTAYGVPLSSIAIAHELRPEEIPNEVRMVVESIEKNVNFP